MKKCLFIIILFISSLPATARHVAGGELFYEYLGPAAGGSNYRVTLRLFRDCVSNGPVLERENVVVGIYANDVKSSELALPLIGNVRSISLTTNAIPCLVGNVNVCYEIGIYSSTVTLADNQEGYTLSRLGCCRVDTISNLVAPSRSIGSNYVTTIPGRLTLPTGHNSSPQFYERDTALVCANKKFTLDFGASDADHDSLTYSFCDAYTSGTSGSNIAPTPILGLIPLPYASPFSGASPLGDGVTINNATGIISGIAPGEGRYVVNVCITEWRNGKAFTQHRKDFILKVQNCDIIEADLPDRIVQCKDSVVHFENLSTSSGITSYLWEFGDGTPNRSSNPTVDYPYADTGRYIAKLTVTGPKGCVGTDSTEVLVYPGFKPGFSIVGSCYMNPFLFNDTTYTRYGVVNSWRWNFGDPATAADTSVLKNPSYKYPGSANADVRLIVGSSKGCIDTLTKTLAVRDKPVLQLPFKDTLICILDTLAIPVNNSGVYSWTPNYNIINANTSRPLVFPKDTTRYIVTVNDNGCTNTDTVTVNVLPFITVDLGNDTVICKTDFIQLHPVSHGLQYQWTSTTGVPINNIKFPTVQPLVTTRYYVTANLGKCQARDSVRVNVVPYPTVQVSPDTTICLGSRIQLRSTGISSSISWTPAASLFAPNTAKPIAGPTKTTQYIATVYDVLGCPKPASDTLVVTVIPPILANAGRDTVGVPDQPIQLSATGGVTYTWSPEYGLNDATVANPIATIGEGIDSVRYRVRVTDQYGCFADDDITIRFFKTGPEIFVPSAFTPNGDGRNDILRPTVVGISRLIYFRLYNRWGQLVFSTSEQGKGWDGIYNGEAQASGAYVYQAEGVDFTGKTIFRKGTAVLIR